MNFFSKYDERLWESLSDKDKQFLSEKAAIICKTVSNPNTRKTTITALEEVMNKIDGVRHNCLSCYQSFVESVENSAEPCSDIEYITYFFKQYIDSNTSNSSSLQKPVRRQPRVIIKEKSNS